MFSRFPLPEPRVIELFELDGPTLNFLKSLPGVQVHSHSHGCQIQISQGAMAMKVAYDPNGNETWLYRLADGQVLGHDTEGAMVPESVWPATESMWAATTPYEFALTCYHTHLAAGLLPLDTLPPNPEDYEE